MKIKYVLILLTLTIFLCSNIYASEINETNNDIDLLEVENQNEPLNSNENINQKENLNLDENKADEILTTNEPKNIYFNASTTSPGNGSIDNPYSNTISYEYISDSNIILDNGEYYIDCPILGNVNFIGSNKDKTFLTVLSDPPFESQLVFYGNCTFTNITLKNLVFSAENLTMNNVNIGSIILAGGNFLIKNSNCINNHLYYEDYGSVIGGIQVFSSSLKLLNCKFINNSADYGGGIYMNEGVLIIDNCLFINNSADMFGGGAIACENNTQIFINNSIFDNNVAFFNYYGGGAIYADNSNLTIENTNFTNSNASFGSAIDFSYGLLNISDCYFKGNNATVCGGAIFIRYSDDSSIVNSSFEDNTAFNSAGGSIHIIYSSVYFENTNFTNSNASFGSAITALSSSLTVNRSNFKKNHAKWYGGAIFHMHGVSLIIDSNFTNNSALYGGGLFIDNLTDGYIGSNFINNSAILGRSIYSFKNNVVFNNNYIGNISDDLYELENFNITFFNQANYPLLIYNATEYDNLPSKYNLTDYGWVSPVKNQLSEGNCWAFAAMAVLESCILKASNSKVLYDFSEENMKNIAALYSDYGLGFLTNNGGFMEMAIGYLASWLGPVSESDDPYFGTGFLSPLLKSIFHVQNVIFLKRDNFTDNDMIKDAIMKYGAVGTSMSYHDYYLNNVSYYCSDSSSDVNHAVAIVGWDDNYSASNFNGSVEGDGAWIVKNSWSEDWGINGYFYVSYYDKVFAPIGNYDVTYTFLLNDTVKFDKNYQYDFVLTQFWDLDGNVSYYNLFNITGFESLVAVSTYFNGSCDYSVKIYVNGDLKSTKKGFSNAGYYTILLDESIQLYAGDILKVSINVNYTNGKNCIPLSDKYIYIYDSNGEFLTVSFNNYLAKENTSFLVYEDNEFDLFAEYNSTACIKAFTIKNKFNSTLDDINNFSFTYGEIGNITINYTNASTVSAFVVGHSEANITINGNVICISNLTVGNYTLNVTTVTDDDHNSVSKIVNFTVIKRIVNFDPISDLNVTYGMDSVSVNGRVSEVNYTGLVLVSINGTRISVNTTVDKGYFSVNIPLNTTLDAGEYTVIVSGNSTKYYNAPTDIYFNLTVNKSDSYLDDIGEFSFVYGDIGSVTVNYNNALTVSAFVVGHSEANITINGNVISISNLTVGNYTLNVTTVTDDDHNGVSKIVNFTVIKRNVNFDPISDLNVTYGSDYVIVNGSVSDVNYAGLIIVSVRDYEISVNTTVDKGYFSVNIPLNTTLDAGEYTVIVSGNATKYYNAPIDIYFKLTINKAKSSLDDVDEFSYDYGDVGSVTVNYTGVNITAFVVKHNEANIIINDNIISISNLTVGNYTLNVTTGRNKNYEGIASKIVNFMVVRKNITFDPISDLNVFYGVDSVMVNGSVSIVNYTGLIVVSINGTSISVNTTVDKGNFSVNIPLNTTLDVGNYTVIVSGNGTMYYNAPEPIFVNLTVNKSDSYLEDIDEFSFVYDDIGSVSVNSTDALTFNAFVVGHSEAYLIIYDNYIYISNLTVGNYTLNVTTVTDDNHNSVSKLVNFTVIKRNVTFNPIYDLNVTYGSDYVIVNGSVSDVNYTGLIIVSVMDSEISVNTTVNGGLFSTRIPLNTTLNAGNYTIIVSGNDTLYYNAPETIYPNLIVNKKDSTLDISSFSFVYGEVGTVVVNYENALNITAFVVGHSEANVIVNGTIISISNLPSGSYVLNVTTVTDDNYNSVSRNVAFSVQVNKQYVTIIAGSASYVINYGGTYTVRLDNSIPNQLIRITLNGETYHKYTNSNGIAIFNLNKAMLVSTGSKTVTISLISDSYIASDINVKLNIVKEKPVFKLLKINKYTFKKSKKTKKIKVALETSKGKLVSDSVKVTIKFKGKVKGKKKYTLTTKKGVVTFKIKSKNTKFKKSGKYSFTVTSEDTKYYSEVSQNGKLRIK